MATRALWAIWIVSILGGTAGTLVAQAPDGPAFEVASIKPNTSGALRSSGTDMQQSGRWAVTNVTLFQLIANAYRLRDSQVLGAPGWITSDRFDIEAKADGRPNVERRALMIQRLLADRFSLTLHHETRELNVFTLVMARKDKKPGPRLRTGSAADADCVNRRAPGSALAAPDPFKAIPPCGEVVSNTTTGGRRLGMRGTTMERLATRLALSLGAATVLNETGLGGIFNVDLEWTSDQKSTTSGDAAPLSTPADAPVLFTALQEQLGLKLVPSKGPVDVVVIDGVQHPKED